MSLVNSLSAMPAVHLPGLRPATPTEGPPAPTSMLMPTAWSRLSTTSLMTSTDSVSRAPTSPLLALLTSPPPSSMESRPPPLSSPVSRPPPPSSRESRSLTPRRSLPPRLLLLRLTPPRRLPSLPSLLRGRGVPPRLLLPESPFPTPTASSPLWPLPPPSPLLLPPPPGRPSSPPSSSTPATLSSTVWTKLCFEQLYLHFPIHPASQTILVPDLLTPFPLPSFPKRWRQLYELKLSYLNTSKELSVLKYKREN